MKVCFVVPYFGIFPNYFNVFLKSCEHNKNITWLFFTDDHTNYCWPDNCIVNYIEFDGMVQYIKSKFDFEIKMVKPYKLCDFKPAYGYIFEEYLQGFDYWGHCDVDCVFGRIDNFINDSVIKYDKILRLGHMTLYKNTYENNRRFLLTVNDRERFREVCISEQSCMFDEDNADNFLCIEDIWREYGFLEYTMDNKIANTWYKGNFFQLVYQKDKSNYSREKLIRGIFYWDNGNLIRIWVKDKKLHCKEYIYIHFMARKMKNISVDYNSKIFKIIPNQFEEVDFVPTTTKDFYREKWFVVNNQYFKVRYRNLKSKIKRKIYGIEYNDR